MFHESVSKIYFKVSLPIYEYKTQAILRLVKEVALTNMQKVFK